MQVVVPRNGGPQPPVVPPLAVLDAAQEATCRNLKTAKPLPAATLLLQLAALDIVPGSHVQPPTVVLPLVGAKAKTPPFARGLRRTRCTNGGKTAGRHTLRLIRGRTKTCDEVVSSRDLVQNGGPRVIRPIVTGPAWPLRVTGLICKGLPVITVCNPALWEYSGDNLGV
jgi:hypothetical protein